MRYEINIETGEVSEYADAEVLFMHKTFEETVAEFEAGIQAHLDTEAQTKGYDNIISACSYAAAPNPFQAEAISFVTWRGEVWAYCYQELAKVQAGTRPMPTIEQIIAELPVRVFP